MDAPRRTRNLLPPSFLIGATVLLIWALVALLAGQVAPYDPFQTVAGSRQSTVVPSRRTSAFGSSPEWHLAQC